MWCGVLGAACAVTPAVWMWGFAVDDAFITIRYARHLASGIGYRFNVAGAVTDGVTPLPFAFVLAPFAFVLAPFAAMVGSSSPEEVLFRSKCLGLVCSALAGGAVGARVSRLPLGWCVGAYVALLACSLPLAAHTVTGMETPLAMALATAAAISARKPRTAALLGGLSASFRPEMLPWALALAFGFGVTFPSPHRAQSRLPWRELLLALAPFLICVAVRIVIFGRPAPLSVYAKPSDVGLGVPYVLSAFVMSAAPLAVLVQLRPAFRHRESMTLVLAAAVHGTAVALAGGDWMAYGRLIAPIVPSIVVAASIAASESRARSLFGRLAPPLGAAVLGLLFFFVAAPKGRHVLADRLALIHAARPYLATRERVACADVGWVSAATENTVIDLGGVTDPEIALLPGSHTSKKIDDGRLRGLHPDGLLLYTEGRGDDLTDISNFRYARAIDARLARSEFVREAFVPVTFLPLGDDGRGYVLLGPR